MIIWCHLHRFRSRVIVPLKCLGSSVTGGAHPISLFIYTWNPNDPCFGWKGPCFGGLTFKNRGYLGSRYIYIYIYLGTMNFYMVLGELWKKCFLYGFLNFDRLTISSWETVLPLVRISASFFQNEASVSNVTLQITAAEAEEASGEGWNWDLGLTVYSDFSWLVIVVYWTLYPCFSGFLSSLETGTHSKSLVAGSQPREGPCSRWRWCPSSQYQVLHDQGWWINLA